MLINLVLPKLHHDRPVRNVALCKVALGGGNLHVYTLSYTVSPYVMIDISVQEKCEEQFNVAASTGTQPQYVACYLNCGSCGQILHGN